MPVSEFGRIGRDAELRYTPSGDAVCNIPVAVDYGRKGQDGKKPTQWYEIALWGKQAEGLAPYLLKGKQVFFTGSDLHIEEFRKGDGSQGVKLVCRASEIKFASDGQDQQAQPQRQQPPAQRPAAQPPQPPADAFDDDIPF
ncbi:single-strand DNA-binding protein [Azotobacter beijerinckii]|uniref:Single-stranded DNA-binding protein n=1 Tax=Azotobacter beijerinckii TaxID=170623 RepID=A0A1H6VDF6_9GAMM|nr:single-stranded DNA-binding protein [Azotobacter beijerinckii]SEI98215.1 single-strand DNA-binding protein [Azotobacter beijerinckii]